MSNTKNPDAAATVPIQGYYAVRKGKGGLRDCIFVSWDRAKEYCDVPDSEKVKVEFSFFAKFQDAIQYIHPNVSPKSYADLCAAATEEQQGTTTPPASDTEKKGSPGGSKRKRLGVVEEKPAKKAKETSEGNSEGNSSESNEGGGEEEGKNSKEDVSADDGDPKESPKDSKDGTTEKGESSKDSTVDTNEKEKGDETGDEKGDSPKDTKKETDETEKSPKDTTKMETDETEKDEETEAEDEPAEDSIQAEAIPSPPPDEERLASLGSFAPLNIILEQGFQQNLPKGWRSQHLGLYLNRRDYFKEPALKQYLQDLKDLQNYRESYSQPARSEEKHFSGASHPLSVYFLNWSWGVCNSYHRDIRRQQKKNTPQPHSQLEGVELPHFKAHTKSNEKPNNYNPKTVKKPSPHNPNTASAKKEAAAANKPENNSDSEVAPSPKPSSLPDILEDAYANFRHRGWRARDILPKLRIDCDDEEEADIHKTYVQQLKLKHYTKEVKKMELFAATNHDAVQRYANNTVSRHPSGITTPFGEEYVQYSWDIKPEDLVMAKEQKEASEQHKPSRHGRTLPTHSAAKPSGEVSSSGPSADTVNSSHFAGGMEIPEGDDETPQLIEALRSSWFRGKDKGWRSVEMGLQVDPRSKTLTMTARKKREQLYVHDLEVLKQWWKTYPSSQHYIFTVPEEGQEEATYKNMSYAASSKGPGTKSDQKRHKSGINAPWSLTYLNWSWGVSNSYNRDLVRKEKRKASYQKQAAQSKEVQDQAEKNCSSMPLYI